MFSSMDIAQTAPFSPKTNLPGLGLLWTLGFSSHRVGNPSCLAKFGLDTRRREKWCPLYRDFATFFEFRGDLGTVRKPSTSLFHLSTFQIFSISRCGDIRVPSAKKVVLAQVGIPQVTSSLP